MLSPDQFYLDDPPTHLQQGDICPGVPILLFPASDELILIRSDHLNQQLEHLRPDPVVLVRELAVSSDAFNTGMEYVAVSAERIFAMLMTPTCDLDGLAVWSVWPMYAIEGSDEHVQRALEAPSHPTLFRLPDNPDRFPPSYIDVTDFRSIGREHFQLKNRVASVTREGQHELVERFVKAAGRPWGYGPGEKVEPLGRYETGKYRCARCNLYDAVVQEIQIGVGEHFPVCENCKKINKTGQWYPLTKHKKS